MLNPEYLCKLDSMSKSLAKSIEILGNQKDIKSMMRRDTKKALKRIIDRQLKKEEQKLNEYEESL
jgi:hypothetical protein